MCNKLSLAWFNVRRYLFEKDISDLAVCRRYIEQHSANLANNEKKTDKELEYGEKWSLSIGPAMYVSILVAIITISFTMLLNLLFALPNANEITIELYKNALNSLLTFLIIIFFCTIILSILHGLRGLIYAKAYEKRKEIQATHNQKTNDLQSIAG